MKIEEAIRRIYEDLREKFSENEVQLNDDEIIFDGEVKLDKDFLISFEDVFDGLEKDDVNVISGILIKELEGNLVEDMKR